MTEHPYSKEVSLNYNYGDVYDHILDVANKIESFSLVTESRTLNKIVIKDINIYLNIYIKITKEEETNLRISATTKHGKPLSGLAVVITTVNNFEEALAASIEGRLDGFVIKKSSASTEGCLQLLILIVAIIAIIFGAITFFSI